MKLKAAHGTMQIATRWQQLQLSVIKLSKIKQDFNMLDSTRQQGHTAFILDTSQNC